MSCERVLVTGASGYIASHIVRLLLEKGYCVRGTVRSLQNEKKVQPLRDLVKNPKYPLELIVADLNDANCWKSAVTDCDYVLHTASPFPASNPKDANEVIKPAIDGTINVLNACYDEPKIKRVVVTSSVVSISGEFNKNNAEVYSELDWPDSSSGNAYARSKTLAEEAAWKYIKTIPDHGTKLPSFELCTVNPAFVIGPVICGQPGTSTEIPRRLMQREMPMLPALNFPMIDVRDVAEAHYKAMITPDANNHRHILSEENYWVKDMAKILHKEFGHQGYDIPLKEAPYFAMWMMSWFDSGVNMVLSSLGKELLFDNTRMKCVLGIEPRPCSQSLIDMVYLMIENGQIKKTSKYVPQSKSSSS